MASILIVEDEENLRFTIRRTLSKAGYACVEAVTVREARAAMETGDFDLVLTDINLEAGGPTGLDFVRELRSPQVGYDGVIVVMTAFSTVENAVAAMRDGADDYIQKPLSLEELGLQVDKWIAHRRLARRVSLYERLEKSREQEHEVLGQSPAWLSTLALADRLAGLPLPEPRTSGDTTRMSSSLPCILLTGETGTGKGVLARYLHSRAAARMGAGGSEPPFVHVNCSALPATLVEGELFGHEKGAFTDARDARPGLFEMADGGTIFLDEVGETPLEFQAKLLLVVEHGMFRRVGGTKERHVRVRVITASNQNLEDRAKAGLFRRDLLYRLNAFTIRLPALRERTGDAELIATAMLDRLARQYGRSGCVLSTVARAAIAAHPWPGNVRELINSVQRAAMLSDRPMIQPGDLGLCESGEAVGGTALSGPSWPSASGLVFDFEHGIHTTSQVEKELIMQALRHTRGNVSRAAKLIQMQRSSLRYRIQRYGLAKFVEEVACR